MLKYGLWPFVLVLFALAFVAIVAKPGNGVRETAQSLPRETMNSVIASICITVAVVLAILGWFTYHTKDDMGLTIGVLAMMTVAAIGGGALLIAIAVRLFVSAASSAAEIGEQLTGQQKKALYRRAVRYFQAFKKW